MKEGEIICPQCGRETPANGVRCVHCGTAFRVCGTCGAVNRADTAFCTNCETQLYAPQPAQEKKRELVRTKTLDLKKISVEEALEEMELVDHDFYIFLNEKTGKVNVVYRRTDGNAGLLDLTYSG